MKLYYTKGACSLVIRILINELKLKSEYESVDLRAKKTESGEDFFKINIKGSVPALITDDGKVLTENVVIQQYLVDREHANQLLPPLDHFQRYQVLELLNFVTTELHKGFSPLFNPAFPQEVKDKFVIPQLQAKFKIMDDRLSQSTYLFGESLTLPDIYFFVMLTWAHRMKVDLSHYSQFPRYFAEMSKRDSIAKSLQEEGLV